MGFCAWIRFHELPIQLQDRVRMLNIRSLEVNNISTTTAIQIFRIRGDKHTFDLIYAIKRNRMAKLLRIRRVRWRKKCMRVHIHTRRQYIYVCNIVLLSYMRMTFILTWRHLNIMKQSYTNCPSGRCRA